MKRREAAEMNQWRDAPRQDTFPYGECALPTLKWASSHAFGLRPNSIQGKALIQFELNQGQVKQKDTREGAPWERLFALQKELRHGLCLQADNALALFANSIQGKALIQFESDQGQGKQKDTREGARPEIALRFGRYISLRKCASPTLLWVNSHAYGLRPNSIQGKALIQFELDQGQVKQKPHRKGVVLFYAPWEIRTLDLPVRSRALYPLS